MLRLHQILDANTLIGFLAGGVLIQLWFFVAADDRVKKPEDGKKRWEFLELYKYE